MADNGFLSSRLYGIRADWDNVVSTFFINYTDYDEKVVFLWDSCGFSDAESENKFHLLSITLHFCRNTSYLI